MIDWKRVMDLRAEIGNEDFEEVVPLFLEEVTEIIDRLRENPNFDQIESDLHCLKGSALNLGFATFSSLCDEGESTAAKGAAKSVNLPAILTSFDASCDVFLAGLEQGQAP